MNRFVLTGCRGEHQFVNFLHHFVPHNIAREFVHLRAVEQIMGTEAPTVYLLEGWRQSGRPELVDEIRMRRAEVWEMEVVCECLTRARLGSIIDGHPPEHPFDTITFGGMPQWGGQLMTISLRRSPSTVPTLHHPDPVIQSLLDWEWNRRETGVAVLVAPSPPKPKASPKLLLSIMYELQSAVEALWDTDQEGHITNPCPQCGKPAWECDDHMPVPNDLRIKPKATKIPRGSGVKGRRKKNQKRAASPGIEWTDDRGRYHRLEDSYLEEAGIDEKPGSHPRGDTFHSYRAASNGRHRGFLLDKPLKNRISNDNFRKNFLATCRRLDEVGQGGELSREGGADRFRLADDLTQRMGEWAQTHPTACTL